MVLHDQLIVTGSCNSNRSTSTSFSIAKKMF